MRKSLGLTIVLVMVLSMAVSAIDMDKNELLRFGGGGGLVEYIRINTTDLNSLLLSAGFAPLAGGVWTFGGGLFTQTETNLRYSNFGAGGSTSSTMITDGGETKYAKLSFGHGGVWLEKIVPVLDNLAFTGGGSASVGGLKLELTHGQAQDFADSVLTPGQTVLGAPFIMIKPQVGVNISLKRYMDLEMKVGYHYTRLVGRWSQGQHRLTGVQPLKNMSGLTMMMNLNFGF